MVVCKNEPIYEADIGSSTDDLSYLHQFILHSSLDILQSAMWTNNQTYLKVIDKFNALQVSAYVTVGGTTFLLLHNGKGDEILKNFFMEIHDIYVKYIMNPFSIYDSPVVSPQFDIQVRQIAKKYLN